MEKENVFSYDYKTVRIKREMETMLVDAYEALGWEVTGTTMSEGSLFYVNVSFKRDRKIENKKNLLKLQDKIDNVLSNIEKLQRSKKNAGFPEAITIGTIGALTFGGGLSMCMVVDGVGFMIGGIALGVVGAGICALAYFINKGIKKRKASKITPILESELDKLADLCEEAGKLAK